MKIQVAVLGGSANFSFESFLAGAGNMTVRDIFGLIVRIAGLIFVVFGFFDVVHVVIAFSGLPMPSKYGPMTDAIAAGFYFIFGAAFIFGANLITRVVYGRIR